jgi:hypothetical protein
MMKSVAIICNLAFILWIGVVQRTDIKIMHDLPTTLKPGEERLITIELDKSDVTGFAKLQFTMDAGLTAEAVETAGSSFTFNNQAAKFIWMALPESRKINLKMRIRANADAEGPLKVNSRFSYIYQNERKNVDAPDHIITVGSSDAAFANPKKVNPEQEENNSVARAVAGRTITNTGINQWRVDVEIFTDAISGFAKVEENFPKGYTAVDIKSTGAVFTSQDQVLKYVWFDVPQQEKITVTYRLLPVIAMDGAKPSIQGLFSFLQGEQTATVPIEDGAPQPLMPATTSAPLAPIAQVANQKPTPPITNDTTPTQTATSPAPIITPAEAAVAQTTQPQTPQTTTPTTAPNTAQSQPKADTPTSPKQAPTKSTPLPPGEATAQGKSPAHSNIVNVPKPEKGVYYRVQIAAGQNNLDKNTFAKLYQFSEPIVLENHQGLYKYTTGHFEVYKAARDERERITSGYNKFKGPFVTAYNDGDRITVQEALLITRQKWFQ